MSSRRAESWPAHVVGRSHRVALLVTLAAVLWVGALAGVWWAAGWSHVWHRLLHPGWLWLGVALVAEGLSYLGYVFAYRDIARAEGGAELETPKAAALVATGFGVFLAGGGFALDREALRRAGMREDEARARVLGLGALEYSILAPAALIAAAAVVARGQPVDPSLTWPWIVGVPVGAVLALTALAFRRRLAGPNGWRARVGHALEALRLLLRLAACPHRYGVAFVGIAVYWLGDIACLWAALHAFDADTPPVAPLIVAYATGYAITRRALPLGGAGVVEALLPFALGWVAIALAPALLAVGAYRLINLWLPMIPALAAIPALDGLEQRNVSRSRAAPRGSRAGGWSRARAGSVRRS